MTSRLLCAAYFFTVLGVASLANADLISSWSGNGTTDDATGLNNGQWYLADGTPTTGTYGLGPGDGQAFSFNGTSFVEAGSLGMPTGNGDRTLDLWFKVNSTPGQSFFAGYGAFGNLSQSYAIGAIGSQNDVFFSQWGTGTTNEVPVTDGGWHNLGVTNQANLVNLYLDGKLVSTATVPINTSNGSPFLIGRIPGDLGEPNNKLDGLISDVKVYNTALSAAEIQALAVPPASTPPPSLETLANLSANVYKGDLAAGEYRSLGSNTNILPDQSDDFSFHAAAFAPTPDTSQIVIAFRGTDLNDGTLLELKNLLNDRSFVTSIPTPLLSKDVNYAAQFVAKIHELYPSARITLTGHSLGGAIAELVGEASGLTTTSFNAPGASDLYSSLSDELAPALGISSGNPENNYRIYGDQVSLAGKPIGGTITLPAPSGVIFAEHGNPVSDLIANWQLYLNMHSMDTVIYQINQSPSLSIGPDNVSLLQDAVHFLEILPPLIPDQLVFDFSLAVLDSELYVIDPNRTTDFVFVANPGSPNFASVILPVFNGLSSYQIRYETNGTWSPFQEINPGVQFFFGTGVNGFEVEPFDMNGNPYGLPDGFLFDVSFDSTGTFSGTLTETIVPTPEPSSLVLLFIGICGLAIWRRQMKLAV